MSARMSCLCGYDFRTATEDELEELTRWHVAREHPDARMGDVLYVKAPGSGLPWERS